MTSLGGKETGELYWLTFRKSQETLIYLLRGNKMTREVVLLTVLLGILALGNAQSSECGGIGLCGECISAGCVWCTDVNVALSRCMPLSSANTPGCNNTEPLTSGSVGETTMSTVNNPINIKNIDLELRVGEPQTFEVSVTAVRNLPLDLYILMDLSSSMGDALNAVRGIAGSITVAIADITNNVNLAFGSFNDKNTQPYTNFLGPEAPQEDPYAYFHRIGFINDTDVFRQVLESVSVTSNVDTPENGLEALLQVINCEQILGWRSRENTQVARLVLWMSDAGFHYAGEGVFGGILEPYREQCGLEFNDMSQLMYTRALDYDYPSVGLVSRLVRARDVNVIFSVPEELMNTYDELARLIPGRTSVTLLTAGGQEILQSIETEYRRLLQDIFIESTDTSGQVTVEVSAMCPNVTSPDGSACSGVQLDQIANFTVSVTLNSCDGLQNGNTKVLTLDSGTFGTFTVTISGICNCDCENRAIPNSERCSGNGNESCGVCECNDGYCGPMCNLLVDTDATTDCPIGGAAFFNQICSGRGRCNCVCECIQEGVFGDACECDDFSEACKANPDDEMVCSGNGTCCNQACICQNSPLGNPYRGIGQTQFCQCEPVEEVCNYEGRLCNNRGTCECDGCSCLNEWAGDFCQIPRAERCNLDEDLACIQTCRALPGPPPDYCTECNPNRPTLFVDMAEIDMNTNQAVTDYANMILGGGFTLVGSNGFALECMVPIQGCINNFYLLDNTTHNALVVVREEDCTMTDPMPGESFPLWSVAIIILGVLIVLGILMIILIKIIFVILDYIEVKRWQNEAKDADFSKNQNPLYQSPEMQYTNVAYGKAL